MSSAPTRNQHISLRVVPAPSFQKDVGLLNKKNTTPLAGPLQMVVEIFLNFARRGANISTCDCIQWAIYVCCNRFCCAGLAGARWPVEQKDEAFAFSSHQVDLCLWTYV